MLGITVPESMLEAEVRQAEGMPSMQSLTRRLNFCEWVQSADPWIGIEVWEKNSGSVNKESLKNRRCWGGLDLSRRDDFTALVLVFEPDENGVKAVLPFFWKPEGTLLQHSQRDGIDYVQWKESGLLMTTPGASINYAFIAAELDKIAATYILDYVAFDPAKIDELTPYLNDIGSNINLMAHRQGYAEMDRAIQSAEEDLLNGRLAIGNHEILTDHVNNVKVVSNPETKRMFSKRDSKGRIDGAVAFVMAVEASNSNTDEPSYAVTVL
jgi:phage terminase large subunit-like protein